MPLKIVRDDLTNMRADAVVLPSNEQLRIDGGAGGAVAMKAGLLRVRRACRKLKGCAVGSAVSTPAYKFPAKYLIHAVGPYWTGGADDARLLRSAYDAALNLAAELKCASVALPLLSAGLYGCPVHVSLSIALSAIEEFLADNELSVTLVLYDRKAVAAGLDFLGEIESRIDDAFVDAQARYMAGSFSPQAERLMPAASQPSPGTTARFGRVVPDEEPERLMAGSARVPWADDEWAESQLADDWAHELYAAPRAPAPQAGPAPAGGMKSSLGLEERLDKVEQGFSQSLLALIDESGMTDAQVYRRANMSRQHFSKIRSNAGYHPSKTTALALCIALQLDLAQTKELLARAGFALSHSNKFDIIIEYFIEHGMYDQFKINETLFYFDQPLLGG